MLLRLTIAPMRTLQTTVLLMQRCQSLSRHCKGSMKPLSLPLGWRSCTNLPQTNKLSNAQSEESENTGIDMEYFKKIVKEGTGRYPSEENDLGRDKNTINPGEIDDKPSMSLMPKTNEGELTSVVSKSNKLIHKSLRPALPKKSSNLAAYVNHSETLQRLIFLGVNLSQLETRSLEAATHLVKANYTEDIEPVIDYLHQRCHIAVDQIHKVINKYPDLFLDFSSHYEEVIEYLEKQGFTSEQIALILTKAPTILSREVKDIDVALGLIQQHFHLKAPEVRLAIAMCPRLAILHPIIVRDTVMTLQDFCGFSIKSQKEIIKIAPKTYAIDRDDLMRRFDYLHNGMGLTHDQILKWPQVLNMRKHVMQRRHDFLASIHRDQYDPTKENFVSLKRLCTGTDFDFCVNVAKSSFADYQNFLQNR